MQFLLETTKMIEQNNDGVKFAPSAVRADTLLSMQSDSTIARTVVRKWTERRAKHENYT